MYPKAEIVLYEYKVPGTRHSIYIPFFLITFFPWITSFENDKKNQWSQAEDRELLGKILLA